MGSQRIEQCCICKLNLRSSLKLIYRILCLRCGKNIEKEIYYCECCAKEMATKMEGVIIKCKICGHGEDVVMKNLRDG